MTANTRRLIAGAIVAVALAVSLSSERCCGADGQVQIAELSPAAEQAIDRGLHYLATHQNRDGSWGARHHSAITALGLMAFMLKGHFPERGEYGQQLEKGLAWLLKRSEEGAGYFGTHNHGMYEHGLATLALSEVWGMSDRQEIRDALKRAVAIILRSQNKDGGWRYHPRPYDADISVTVMQIVALASAAEAGILVPAKTISQALEYVKRCQHKFQGGFGYTPGGAPGFARTSAGLLSLQMCGERESRSVDRGLSYIKRLPESKFDKERFYLYGHYYAIQAMYQAGEGHYQEWYPQIREALLAKQRKDGSWSPGGGESDPCYGTGMSILILGVPYRFLPISQR